MADYSSTPKGRGVKKTPDSHLVRVLKSYNSPSDKHFEEGLKIGKGSILYYPKQVADAMVRSGIGERVFGLRPRIYSW